MLTFFFAQISFQPLISLDKFLAYHKLSAYIRGLTFRVTKVKYYEVKNIFRHWMIPNSYAHTSLQLIGLILRYGDTN